MNRIQFTKKELELILSMLCIAEAGNGDGDYASWKEENFWKATDSLTWKVAELLHRLKRKTH
jgi:hypothetical protein